MTIITIQPRPKAAPLPQHPPPPMQPPPPRKPTTGSPIQELSDYGHLLGVSAADHYALPKRISGISMSALSIAVKAALRQAGISKLRGDRLRAFQSTFYLGFVRRCIERTREGFFWLVVEDPEFGTKNISLTPDANSPYWQLRYLDSSLDTATVGHIRDPFAEIALLGSRQWPSQS